MSEVGRRIVGHGGIYLLGSLLARVVSFIMLPIYTRKLTPADYGVIELLTMTIDLVGLLVSMRIAQSVYRYYFKYDLEADRNQVLFSSYVMTIFSNVVGMAFVIAFSDKLALAVFGNAEMSGLMRLFSLSLVFQGLIEAPMVMIRAQQKPWLYLFASVTKLIMMLSLNIYFVVFKQMHVEGVVYSALLSGGVMSLVLGVYLVRSTGFRFSPSKAKEMTKFSLPFLAIGALSFYINFGDRYFLRIFGSGLDSVGIYSLGYKFGFLLGFIVGDPFFNVWDSEKFRIFRESDNPIYIYQRVFLAYVAIVAITGLGLSLFGKNAIMFMANKEYWKATEIIPVICLAYALNCFMGFANLGLLVKERTIDFTYGAIIAAVVVSAGYFYLIPPYGAVGAAWATLLAYAARLVWIANRSRKLYDMHLDWKCLFLLGSVVGVIWKISDILGKDSIYLSLAVNVVAIAVALCAFLFLPILPEDLRKDARQWVRNPMNSFHKFKAGIGR